ncbi:HNH endonuclease signature motif containing protein [Rhizobium sp. Leaf371]|uniref:HNH endonuclease signature motif containing protein n=1 Tax=Rhizobium sp. Leaf371 TaxID=1736355 RepID=UPI0009EAC271|nr:HNH endonuclease signature motif containing protein [Rhizobium sp. Leaf371]
MPYSAPSLRACGCVVASGSKCQHGLARDRERKAAFDQQRPSARERGYDSKWDKERKAYLLAHPTCATCGEPATVVDHVIPHRGDKKLFWSRSNWQPLCTPCHSSTKQRLERKA